MTAETTTRTHEAYCNHHEVAVDDSMEYCCRETVASAIVDVDAGDNGPEIRLWQGDGPELTAAEARVIAAALLEAAEIVENA